MKAFKKRTGILPLSSNPELDRKSIIGIDAYYTNLDDAFRNPRIRNIAITGQRGVGKSSLIKSFDANHRSIFRRGPRFLYVSLGQYESAKTKNIPTVSPKPLSTCKITDGAKELQMTLDVPEKLRQKEPNESTNVQGNIDEQNAIERRMLLQICSKFKNQDFPASGFRLIPRQPGKLASFGFVMFAMSIMLLLMKKTLADLLYGWSPQKNDIIDFFIKWHTYFEAVLYGIVFIGAALLFYKYFKRISVRGKASKIALKTSNTEWDLDEFACEDYLDQYTQELIYCLSQVSKKIDRTVVFEDMDRLDKDICTHIFTRLREINHILNTHVRPEEYVRFIFVVDDEITNSLSCDKFFDFIMPVLPTLNRNSAEVIFRENLKKINSNLECSMKMERLAFQLGTWGAKVITFLDKHPLLKELCCHFRNLCRWVKKKIGVLAQWRIYQSVRSNLCKIINPIKKILSPIYKGLKRIRGTLEKYFVCRHLFRWIGRQNGKVLGWFGRQKKLFLYQEPQRNCDKCGKSTSECLNCIRKVEEETGGIVQMTAEYLTDYRKLYTILNEYSLMMRLYHSNNMSNMTCKTAEQILAFQIYKHLWPQDYQNLLDGKEKDSVLTGKSMDDFKEENKDLLTKLLDNKLLSVDSLYYAGFSRSRVTEIWEARLKNGNPETVIKSMDPLYAEHQELVQEHCRVKKIREDPVTKEILIAAIRFSLKDNSTKESENDWFFANRVSKLCLEVLAGLSIDERNEFIKRCKTDKNRNIFEKCYLIGDKIIYDGEWNRQMAEAFAMGASQDMLVGSVTLDDGTYVEFQKLKEELGI